jgi:hypothetical protein
VHKSPPLVFVMQRFWPGWFPVTGSQMMALRGLLLGRLGFRVLGFRV